jgi:catechol 2,3-dioxygenase-like lactoylglutathione lyase family enzyme
VAFLDDGHMHLHVARKDVQAGFRTGQIVNPVSHGHVAYRCDDIEAFKRHLDAQGVAYSDWGQSAVKGWHQVYFYDPDGNVIEVHQVVG